MTLSSVKNARPLHGFTLIEMLIVMAIIGILAGLSVPAYVGYRVRARDTSGQSDCGLLKVAATSIYVQDGSYANVASGQELFDNGFTSSRVQGRYVTTDLTPGAVSPLFYIATCYHPGGTVAHTATAVTLTDDADGNPGPDPPPDPQTNSHCHPDGPPPTTCNWHTAID